MVLRAALLTAAALAACSDGARPDCFIGDRAQPAEVSLLSRSLDGRAVPVADGGSVSLVQPPQGGRVVFVGVRARNVSCVVQLTASLRDNVGAGASNRVAGHEGRPVTLVAGADGSGTPKDPLELENYSNVPACPSGNIALQKDLFDRPYTLEVRIEDRSGKTAQASLVVVPRCDEPPLEAQCRCECAGSYVLGAPCETDGGVTDGGA